MGSRTSMADEHLVWQTDLAAAGLVLPPVGESGPNPVIVDDTVIASFSEGRKGQIVALDRTTGQRRWTRVLDAYAGPAVVVVGRRILCKTSRTVSSLDVDSGDVLWSWTPIERRGEWIYTLPAVEGSRVFVGDREGAFHCLDLETGRHLWRVCPVDPASQINATAAVVDDLVIAADNGGCAFAVEAATGTTVWVREVGGPSVSRVERSSRGVIVRTEMAMRELAPRDGAILWSWQGQAPLWHHAVRADTVFVVQSGEMIESRTARRIVPGRVVCLKDGAPIWNQEAQSQSPFVRLDQVANVLHEQWGLSLVMRDPQSGDVLRTLEWEDGVATALPDTRAGVVYQIIELIEPHRLVAQAIAWPPR